MSKHIIASWEFVKPMSRQYVYADGTYEQFNHVTKVTVFSTGCQQLRDGFSDVTFIVHPGWRYIRQEPSK